MLEYKAAMHKVEELEQQAVALDRQNEILEQQKLCGQVQAFGGTKQEAFVEFVKSLAPQTMKQKLEEAKTNASEYNQQRKNH